MQLRHGHVVFMYLPFFDYFSSKDIQFYFIQSNLIVVPSVDHLNDLNGDVKEALKSSIFVVQKAATPKNGVEFRQGSIGVIRSGLATLYEV